MNKWHRVLHSIVVVGLMLALWLGLAVIWFGLAVEVFEDQVTPHQPTWMMLTIVAALLTLGAGICAIALKARWPWLGGGALVVAALYGFLAYDALPPPPIDLGVRIEKDDPTYQTIMWFSDQAPSSRLKEANAADWEDKELILSGKSEDWAEHLQKKESQILVAWENEHLGREWIKKLSKAQPKGIWRNKYYAPYLNYKPINRSSSIQLATALLAARSGQGDEALQQVDQLLRAIQTLEQTSPGFLHQMIVTVLKKRCYQAAEMILNQGNCSPAACRSMQTTVTAGLAPKVTFKRMFEGEKEFMRSVVEDGIWRDVKFQADMKQAKLYEVLFAHGAKWLVLNPNETNRQTTRIMDEIYNLAVARDTAAMESYKVSWNTASFLKNPAGRLITNQLIPAFQKATSSVWANEDRRQALLKKLAEAK